MEIGNTIRNLRTDAGMSQEELAELVFVSRQTISNWENDKFYPDVQSLALIAEHFGTSIDTLVKGDLPMIETRIAEEDVKALKRNATFFGVLLVVSAIVMAISIVRGNWLALASGAIVYALSLYFGYLVENDKKKCDVSTYREIKALYDGASVEEIRALRETEEDGNGLMKKIVFTGIGGIIIGLAAALLLQLF